MSSTHKDQPLTEKKLPTLMELIDRYVPRHTREEVVEMSIRYEERITALLRTIHDYHQRCHALQVHLAELEEEYAKKTMIPASYGKLSSQAEFLPHQWANRFTVYWRPDPMTASITVAQEPIRKDEYPRLFEATMKEFERGVVHRLTEQLRGEYAKLYEASRPK
ncbi:hypothetical protein [Sinorhizobium meliloti]|uniref:hypothetical protein n=1 Tax=Rhizobium meliloti TaxID=382 RepID=UPI000FD9B0A5|nr:hypothetical protein [Sinorhizobium meliloti]RVP24576.1 hypothetical protein CN080_09930 [Sinorhizobium meliloti]RVP24678.1 hypothetical protein CN080_10470 [Sinorhizobium meliloti]